jgi:hypothetical protein
MKRLSVCLFSALLLVVLGLGVSAQEPPAAQAPPAVEAAPAAACAIGSQIDVLWNDSWYASTIIAGPNAEGQCQIHYDGWESSWDEWVGADRMRPRSGFCTPGNAIQVLWNDSWYDSTVVSGTDDACTIHYDGWDSSWDEVVGLGRMRARP